MRGSRFGVLAFMLRLPIEFLCQPSINDEMLFLTLYVQFDRARDWQGDGVDALAGD